MNATLTDEEKAVEFDELARGFEYADGTFAPRDWDSLQLGDESDIVSAYDFYDSTDHRCVKLDVNTLCKASATLWLEECAIRDREIAPERKAVARSCITQANRLRNKAIGRLDDTLLRIWPETLAEDAIPVVGTYGFALDSYITLVMKGMSDDAVAAHYADCRRRVAEATSEFLDNVRKGKVSPVYMQAIASSRTRYYAR